MLTSTNTPNPESRQAGPGRPNRSAAKRPFDPTRTCRYSLLVDANDVARVSMETPATFKGESGDKTGKNRGFFGIAVNDCFHGQWPHVTAPVAARAS
jgi:hypothetical protein